MRTHWQTLVSRCAVCIAALVPCLAAGCDASGPAEPRVPAVDDIAADVVISPSYPTVIPLPTGFQPEGIAVGNGDVFYVGASLTGAVLRGNLRTGEGAVLVPPAPGVRMSFGVSFDRRSDLVFVAGGLMGAGYVYDAKTGETVQTYPFATPGASFVNDVVVTRRAAYFTESLNPVLYRLPLGPGGELPDPTQADRLPLSGDFLNVSECPLPFPAPMNANGIDATPDGEHLVLVNLCLGTLYRVDAETGVAKLIDLEGAAVPFGDGILLDGYDLYVVQNVLNQIAVVQLDPQFDAGVLTRVITDPHFRVPSTIAEFGDALYAVNARFDVAPPLVPAPDVEFQIVRVPKK